MIWKILAAFKKSLRLNALSATISIQHDSRLWPCFSVIHISTVIHRKKREKITTSSLSSIKILPGYLHLGATILPPGNLLSWGNGMSSKMLPKLGVFCHVSLLPKGGNPNDYNH